MRPIESLAAVAALALAACGPGRVELESHPPLRSAAPRSPESTACASIAAEYHAEFIDALACDPTAPDACTQWRPLTVANVGSDGAGHVDGLCWVASVGYVSPQNVAALDATLDRYKSAGCAVSYCPGPPPHQVACKQGAFGFTCDGM